jgi:hypothetical protein
MSDGNQAADRLTRKPTHKVTFPVCPITYQRFVLVKNGSIIEGNICQLIMEKCKQHNMKGWEKQTKGKTLTAVLNEKSDFTIFTWPLGNRNCK